MSSSPRISRLGPNGSMETFHLGSFRLPRVWSGLWQLSSSAWGTASLPRIREAMTKYVEARYTAFADHYGSAEIIFGQFRRSLPADQPVFGATKWCVFTNVEPSQELVEAAIQERMERMQINRIDLLQFHWQDYSHKGYLKALEILQGLKTQGWISALGICNFDSIRTDEICTQLGPGVISSNQVQFSLIDTRPLHGMADVCEKHGVQLLCYGTLCGGFLSEVWLNEPMPDRYSNRLTPSQRKYLDMIVGAWGNWQLFQDLLLVLKNIGDSYGLSISNIATRWVLDHSFVGAVIIGTRLGISEHLEDNLRVNSFRLSEVDRAALDAVLNRSNGRRIITTIGDCGGEYR
ncbi:NADP-dependent oxidoreductase domain-containing protein [Lentinula raphanica]|uniref:NADP-dependent oxidoreductase domain-containing protein n=1 Tax=Lentinula raphanica TaxID=153919 RepID=A0AA38P5U1_9AGAR|nr:NADP-dependent oxidoreductase domain-containing protein [Lentinula raphanica]KAJ3836888.1 NADP-dependent oxidoreductase domain-containing protein [Lentinula raphanica]KAJ3969736.1 NADP-dependent oxidoreductase domain-containing protein [Lentinula raphanica]